MARQQKKQKSDRKATGKGGKQPPTVVAMEETGSAQPTVVGNNDNAPHVMWCPNCSIGRPFAHFSDHTSPNIYMYCISCRGYLVRKNKPTRSSQCDYCSQADKKHPENMCENCESWFKAGGERTALVDRMLTEFCNVCDASHKHASAGAYLQICTACVARRKIRKMQRKNGQHESSQAGGFRFGAPDHTKSLPSLPAMSIASILNDEAISKPGE